MELGYGMESPTKGHSDDQSATKTFPVSPVPIGKAQVVYVRQVGLGYTKGEGK